MAHADLQTLRVSESGGRLDIVLDRPAERNALWAEKRRRVRRGVARDRIVDADDFGAERRQEQSGRWPGKKPRQIENSDARENLLATRYIVHLACHLTSNSMSKRCVRTQAFASRYPV